jgi:hypothetical protein
MTQRNSIRWWWLALAFLCGVATAMFAEELRMRTQGNRIEFTVPRTHFISGRLLARLKNAEPIALDVQVRLASGVSTNVVRQNTARFAISYDLWEERFSVTQLAPVRKTASHMQASDAEAWCVQQMAITDLAGVSTTQPLWAHMEIRADAERETRLFGISDAGISLTGLVEIFARPAKASQPHWSLDAGPVTLDQLRRGG